MAVPFPEAQFEALIWMSLGFLASMVIFLTVYIRKLHSRLEADSKVEESSGESLRTDNIGLSRRSRELLDTVIEEPRLQSDLPGEMEVSKATVSNAVSELKERGLIKRKKRANTYRIEPDMDKLEEAQR